MVSPGIILSIIAILLSLISIRRQRIPTKYEAERRIREKFEQTDTGLEFSEGRTTYRIISITVTHHEGWNKRLKEYLTEDIAGRTQLAISTNGKLPDSIDVENVSVISAEGSNLALTLDMESTDPSEVYTRFMIAIHDELPEYVREDRRPP